MRRIFISHSTDMADAAGQAYLNTLVSGLADARDEHGLKRFEIFWDEKSLTGGDDWSLKIVNHLVYCDAAVLVLSPRALDSDFVKFEASNLMARRARQRDPNTHQPLFDVIPVIPWVDGVETTPQALEKEILAKLDAPGFWKAIGFNAGINYSGPSKVETILPDLIAKLSDVGAISQDAAIAHLERDIATYLEGVKRELLEAAAAAAGFNAPAPADTDAEAAMTVARGLLLAPLDLMFNALLQMKASLKQKVVDVFDLLAPCWVSPEAARLLVSPLNRKPPGSCAILNGTIVSFTPEMYVRRARGMGRKLAGKVMQIHEPVSAANDFEELRHRVRKLLRDMVPVPGDVRDAAYAATLKKQLQIRSMVVPHVVAMPLSSQATLPLLARLSSVDEFAHILFIGLSGGAVFETSEPAVVSVTPELRLEQESYVNTLYDQIVELIA